MNIDYDHLESNVYDGTFRTRLQEELTIGFRQIIQAGERLPAASHYAAQIAEIVNRGTELSEHVKFELYQEVLEAVEAARAAVLGEDKLPS
ncbi:MAG TPA: hypothetical protein VEK11_03330 [Thermoanaerobaculia bacterium]|nr:hypothetical protein [Thermoanaerobaculia bacterium]